MLPRHHITRLQYRFKYLGIYNCIIPLGGGQGGSTARRWFTLHICMRILTIIIITTTITITHCDTCNIVQQFLWHVNAIDFELINLTLFLTLTLKYRPSHHTLFCLLFLKVFEKLRVRLSLFKLTPSSCDDATLSLIIIVSTSKVTCDDATFSLIIIVSTSKVNAVIKLLYY